MLRPNLRFPVILVSSLALSGSMLTAQQHTQWVPRNLNTCPHFNGNAPPYTKPVGVNMNFYQYYISAIANADLSKRGLDWIEATGNGQESHPPQVPTANTAGWPLEPSVSSIFAGGPQRPQRNGLDDQGMPDPDDYLILVFDQGTGAPLATQLTDVVLCGDATLDHEDLSQAPKILRFYTTDQSGGFGIFIRTINDWDGDLDTNGDGVGDGDGMGGESFDPGIELWVDGKHMAAYQLDNTEIWFDQFLTRLQELELAFIRTGPDWSLNNFASETELGGTIGKNAWFPDWNERTLLDDPLWSVNDGVPWELHVWLANKLHVNLWVCIPFIAYDLNDSSDPRKVIAQNYVESLATFIKTSLDDDLHCYVEFSNETWNAGFSTNRFLVQNYPGQEKEMNALYADEYFHWWTDMWNDCRVELMAMGDAADETWAQALVTELQSCNLVDTVGCAGYFKPSATASTGWGNQNPPSCIASTQPDATTLYSELLSQIDANGDGVSTPKGSTTLIRNHAQIAVNEGLRLYLYEGGPSLLTNCPSLQGTYASFQNTQQEIGDLVTHELDRFINGTGLAALGNWPNDPATGLPLTVGKFGFYAFCQQQNAQSGDWLLLTDLYHGTMKALVNVFDAFKFDAFKVFSQGF